MDDNIIKYCIIPYLDKCDDIEKIVSCISNKFNINIKINLVNDWPKKAFYPIDKMIFYSFAFNESMLINITKIDTLIIYEHSGNYLDTFTDNGCKYLGDSGIKTLICNYNTSITDIGIQYIDRIENLIIGGCSLTNNCFKYLSNVRILSLTYASFQKDDGLQYLQNVRKLILSTNKISDNSLKYIPNVTYLQLYNIYQTNPITIDGIRYLSKLKKLLLIRFADIKLLNKSIEYIELDDTNYTIKKNIFSDESRKFTNDLISEYYPINNKKNDLN